MSALTYWLWLSELPGLTNLTRLALLQKFETPERIFYADPDELRLTEGYHPPAGTTAGRPPVGCSPKNSGGLPSAEFSDFDHP